jgi:tetratricopeptide (TPR) repeat protein
MRKQCFQYISLLLGLFLFAGCGEKLTEEQLLAKSREAELNADYRQAKKYYEKLVKDYPQNSEIEAARQKIALIEKAESLPEDKLQAEIQNYESHEQFKDALVLYNVLLARFPKYEKRDELLQKIGLVYLNNQEQYQRAVDAYQRLLQDHPESKHAAQAQFMVGYIYANHIKDLDKARQAYNTFKEKYPQHELTPSVDWELDHLGKDIGDLDFIATSKNETSAGNGQPQPSGQQPASGPKAQP